MKTVHESDTPIIPSKQPPSIYKLAVFIPESHLDTVKNALFASGAGRIGAYDHCCWQLLGQGQFRPLSGAKPFMGRVQEITTVAEYKVEMVVAEAKLKAVLKALRQSHPYEEPAFDLWPLTCESAIKPD